MKNLKIISVLLILTVAFSVFADDFDDFGDFGSDGGFDDFSDFDSFGDFGDSSSDSVHIGGEISSDFRYYLNDEDNPVKTLPAAKVSLDYDTDRAGFKVVFDVNQDKWENSKIDLIDELSIKGYFGNFQVEAGKLRVVWGKGDKLHVLDNFNSDDYTNFIVPEYINRRISVPMIRASYSVPTQSNITVEGIYTPFIAKDRFNTSGALVPYSAKQLTSAVTAVLMPYISTPALLPRINEINNDSDVLYPNLYRLKYSQFGARITGTVGRIDWGASYYNGFYKQPSLNALKLNSWASDITKEVDFLEFDRKQTFGLEAASTVWHFNVRGEVAYNLTEDTSGNDPWTHNSSLQWLAGFDIDLPLWNMNFNLQETGSLIFNGDKCDDNTRLYAASGAKDVDYNSNGYWDNMFVANLSASFDHDKLKPEISALWNIDRNDFVLIPKVSYDLTPNLNVNILMLHIYSKNDNSKFFGFQTNDFVQLGAVYKF